MYILAKVCYYISRNLIIGGGEMFIKEKERIYMNNDEGKLIAEITFPEIREGVNDINRTFVDRSLRGQGMAGKLMQEAVDTIRANGNEIVASCSYAVKWLEEEEK